MSAQTIQKEKTCTRCSESWPADAEFFATDRTKEDGLHDQCKACRVDCYYNRRNFGQLTKNLCGVFTALVTKQEQAALANQ